MGRVGASRRRRGRVAWWRIALALALAGTAILVARQGIAAATRKGRPAAALALAPWDSRALSAEAERMLAGSRDAPSRARAFDLARRALRRDATNVSAVATLGFAAALKPDRQSEERLFGYAQRLSRRDLRTQIWFVERAVARGDVAGALRHYDVALRTSRNARDTLFPILSAAIAAPQVRDAATAVLAKQPVWADPFLYHAAVAGPDPVATADLFGRLHRRGYLMVPNTQAVLMERLVSAGLFDVAWTGYVNLNRRATRTQLRGSDFRQATVAVTAFDWNTPVEGGLAATLPDQRGAGLDVQASPGAGGTGATQLQLLPPGRYRLIGRVRGLSAGVAERPYWTLVCATGTRAVLGRVPIPASGDASANFGGEVVVPRNCPAQSLQLIVPADDAVQGVSFIVESITLRRRGEG